MAKHVSEPGIPGFLTDIIERGIRREYPEILWTVSYQGSTDYEHRGHRLEFRWAKVAWSLGHRNYPDEESFNRQHNGDWGMVHWYMCEPVDAATLELFRKEWCPTAVTGYYDHLTDSWIECEPTSEKPSHASWLKKQQMEAVAA